MPEQDSRVDISVCIAVYLNSILEEGWKDAWKYGHSKIGTSRVGKRRVDEKRGREERTIAQSDATMYERRGFGGSRFLLEAHLEKATPRRMNKKMKNARKPSGERENRSHVRPRGL